MTARHALFLAVLAVPSAGWAGAAPWQNPTQVLDVSGDGLVSPIDVLLCIDRMNRDGTGALPAPSTGSGPPPFVDVNGDDQLTPVDPLIVINYLNGAASGGPGGQVGVSTRTLDAAGLPATTFAPGATVVLEVYVEDVRPAPAGVFSAYLDVVYDSTLVSLVSPPTFGGVLLDVHEADTSTPGRVRDFGGTSSATPSSLASTLLGALEFQVDPSLPGPVMPTFMLTHARLDPLLYDLDAPATFVAGALCDDGDDDGVCDADDACVGDDLTGDLDGDGVCDDLDLCYLDDARGDGDADGVCDLLLAVGRVTGSVPLTLRVADAEPGSPVYFFVSTTGPGPGPCAPTFAVCLDIRAPVLLGTSVATGAGLAQRTIVPPALPSGLRLAFQAAWGNTGTGQGETSNVVLRRVP
jgi:hypothetical protein